MGASAPADAPSRRRRRPTMAAARAIAAGYATQIASRTTNAVSARAVRKVVTIEWEAPRGAVELAAAGRANAAARRRAERPAAAPGGVNLVRLDYPDRAAGRKYARRAPAQRHGGTVTPASPFLRSVIQ